MTAETELELYTTNHVQIETRMITESENDDGANTTVRLAFC